jgi:hypothetical protein
MVGSDLKEYLPQVDDGDGGVPTVVIVGAVVLLLLGLYLAQTGSSTPAEGSDDREEERTPVAAQVAQ